MTRGFTRRGFGKGRTTSKAGAWLRPRRRRDMDGRRGAVWAVGLLGAADHGRWGGAARLVRRSAACQQTATLPARYVGGGQPLHAAGCPAPPMTRNPSSSPTPTQVASRPRPSESKMAAGRGLRSHVNTMRAQPDAQSDRPGVQSSSTRSGCGHMHQPGGCQRRARAKEAARKRSCRRAPQQRQRARHGSRQDRRLGSKLKQQARL